VITEIGQEKEKYEADNNMLHRTEWKVSDAPPHEKEK
jgi:hypothetical protein